MGILPSYSVKEIVDLIKKGSDIEAQETILKFRETLLELQQENLNLKNLTEDLKKQLEIKGKIVFETPYYFLVDGDNTDGPYCQQCYDNENKLIRLFGGEKVGEPGWYECKTCKNAYTDESYDEDYIKGVRLEP